MSLFSCKLLSFSQKNGCYSILMLLAASRRCSEVTHTRDKYPVRSNDIGDVVGFSSVVWPSSQADLLIQCGKLVPVNSSSEFNSQSRVHLWDVSWLTSAVSYKLGVGSSGFRPLLGLCKCRGLLSIYVCNG